MYYSFRFQQSVRRRSNRMPLRQSSAPNNSNCTVDSEGLFQIEGLEDVSQRYLSDTEESDEGKCPTLLQWFHVCIWKI